MSNEQHLIENALVDFCYCLKHNKENDFKTHWSGLVKEQAKECEISLELLEEFCRYIVFHYGFDLEADTRHEMTLEYGYDIEGVEECHFYKNYYQEEEL